MSGIKHTPMAAAMAAARMRHIPVEDLPKYAVAARSRAVHGCVYDTVTYDGVNGHDKLEFFKTIAGKSLEECNLTTPGHLPSGWSMLVTGAQVLFIPGVANGRLGANAKFDYTNDMAAFYSRGLLHVKVGQDDAIYDGPLSLFPGETRLIGDVSFADTYTADDNKAGVLEIVTLAGKSYSDFEPFSIIGQQEYTAALEWFGTKVPMPSGLSGKVRLRLTGSVYNFK